MCPTYMTTESLAMLGALPMHCWPWHDHLLSAAGLTTHTRIRANPLKWTVAKPLQMPSALALTVHFMA
jgi:hypothetical protein